MKHPTNTIRRRSPARRRASVRRGLSLAALVSLAACGARAAGAQEGGSADDVLAFMRAGTRGDEARQMALLVAPGERNENGARVMRELHRPRDLRHFEPATPGSPACAATRRGGWCRGSGRTSAAGTWARGRR